MRIIPLFILLCSAGFTLSSTETQEPVVVDPVVNSTEVSDENVTLAVGDDQQNATTTNATFKVSCMTETPADDYVSSVQIVNSTQLLSLMNVQGNITSLQTPATCLLVFFFSPSCPFSCKAAPHYNALGRIFKNFKAAAVDTSSRHNFNAQYGIVGVPSLLLFHNGRPAARFLSTADFNLVSLIKFIVAQTGSWSQSDATSVTSADFLGPISSTPVQQTDYCLILSWIFIILCGIYFFYYSSWCQFLVDSVRSAWREAEAQHHHAD